MQVLDDNVNLVIVGAWNPAILTPSWIAEKAMGRQVGANFPVHVQLPLGQFQLGIARPRLKFEGITVAAEQQALTFQLAYDDQDPTNLGVTTAVNILDLLPHTPVTGFGFNFAFQFDDPSKDLLATFSGMDFLTAGDDEEDEAKLVRRVWQGVVTSPFGLITVIATYEGGTVRFDVNVHRELFGAAAAAAELRRDNLFIDVKERVLGLIRHFDHIEGVVQ